jgi:hypothetical protein
MEIYSLESNSNAPVSMIPIEHIEILNPRDRNEKVFAEIVESIRTVGLKNPSLSPEYLIETDRINSFAVKEESKHLSSLEQQKSQLASLM